jgi:hypothetical protein
MRLAHRPVYFGLVALLFALALAVYAPRERKRALPTLGTPAADQAEPTS